MASLEEAQLAGERAWDTMQAELHMRPSVVGVIHKDGGFGLRITLPRTPPNNAPSSLFGVPVEYRTSIGEARLLSSRKSWRKPIK